MTNRYQTVHRPGRRQFLRHSAAISAGLMLGAGASGVIADAVPDDGSAVDSADRRLRVLNAHTWEKIDVVYYTRGSYIDESLASINHLMRDHRANESISMDAALIDQLAEIQKRLASSEYMHVLSGYRTPQTNAALRKRSSNVAKFSLHMEGRAADIHVPGLPTRELQSTAKGLEAGGVGYYGRSGFVHVDTGKIRHWER